MLNPLTPAGIRTRREGLGLSRREFAQILDVAEASIRSWETGKTAPFDPIGAHMVIGGLEDEFLNLIDYLTEPMDGEKPEKGEPLQLRSYLHQGDYEAMEPYWSKLLPLPTYRMAVAQASLILQASDIPVCIVGVED
ncbi:DNA-binding transcriptional regulator [uncultured Actinomyces sp.]|uniref:helix-turn-helix domain-containing protein n=1 Tax=uncultured Actinomyces sp. TaxID=249061 RepID=UPI0026321273|nr:helix-turn-helix domain-containing protein [uncultured Actinomyces sp.]